MTMVMQKLMGLMVMEINNEDDDGDYGHHNVGDYDDGKGR